MLKFAFIVAALNLLSVGLVSSQPIGTNTSGFVLGPVTPGNCAKFINAATIGDAGKTCGHIACTPDGGTNWGNACDLPLLLMLTGF
jgi:hypothetical protein